MAGNPVFDRFNKDLARGDYAGFGSGQQPQYGQFGQGQPYQPPTQQPQFGGGQQWGQQAPQSPQPAKPYDTPGGSGRTMTLDDVVTKTLLLFAMLLVTGAAGWFAASHSQPVGLALWIGGMIGTIALGFVISFKKTISVPLIIGYALLEGAFLGAVSQFFNTQWPGVVGQAVLATLCVFTGMFAGWKFGVIRVTDRSRKIFAFAAMGYFLFAIVNLVLQMTGVLGDFGFFSMGTFGIVLCLVAVALASYSLAVSFDTIQRGVAAGVPEKTSWLLAHGLIVSVAWLYIELLRLFAISRD
ncbi:Bax inhibitor-1/YccA family protein [Calidifontibacter terrae]